MENKFQNCQERERAVFKNVHVHPCGWPGRLYMIFVCAVILNLTLGGPVLLPGRSKCHLHIYWCDQNSRLRLPCCSPPEPITNKAPGPNNSDFWIWWILIATNLTGRETASFVHIFYEHLLNICSHQIATSMLLLCVFLNWKVYRLSSYRRISRPPNSKWRILKPAVIATKSRNPRPFSLHVSSFSALETVFWRNY